MSKVEQRLVCHQCLAKSQAIATLELEMEALKQHNGKLQQEVASMQVKPETREMQVQTHEKLPEQSELDEL